MRHRSFIKTIVFVALHMARVYYKNHIFLLCCSSILLGCSQQPESQESTIVNPEKATTSSIEQLYQMASEKNSTCLPLTDSILNTTSDPNSRAEAFYIKGLYYSNIKDVSKAEQYLDSTIRENYTFYDAYIEKGILLNERGDYKNALNTFQIALEITKNNADLYYWIGKSYEGLKMNKEAQAYYNMTLKLDPTYQSAEEALKRTKQ
ncbi:MAG: tetratricopeptide repeat protein [Chitinophagia bacterium]|nr:tetratricopeptide repeat protein [Chitinophagia bacterium]